MESDFKVLNVNYTTNITTLTDLAVYTMYFINVSAVSSGGVGPANMTMTRTDAEGNEIFKIVLNLRSTANDEIKCSFKESSARVWSQLVDKLKAAQFYCNRVITTSKFT